MPPTHAISRAVDAVLWTAALAVLGAVVFLSVGPGGPRTGIFAADKLWHALSSAALTGSWLLAAAWRPGRGPGRFPGAALSIVVGAAVLGGVLELLQGIVGRSADPLDWLADVAGITGALGAWVLLRRGAPT